MNSDILAAGIGHLERSSTVPADHNIAMCWVEVGYGDEYLLLELRAPAGCCGVDPDSPLGEGLV